MLSVALFAYAAALTGLARLLPGRGWTSRAPRLAIVTWQCLTASVVAAVVSGGLALLVPSLHFHADLSELLRACMVALQARYATPAGTVAGVAGAVLAAAVVLRVGAALLVTIMATARWRRRHTAALAVLSAPTGYADACVLAQDEPLVYCLPGAQRRIVMTTGALRRLSAGELRAVLCHEREHLRQRHHLVLAGAAGMRRAFPRSRLMGTAYLEIERLVELLADDAAIRTSDRLDLAAALLRLGDTASPRYALGVADTAAAQRVRRLIEPPRRLGQVMAGVVYALAAVMLALPVAALVGPALVNGSAAHCPAHLD
jgi:beta-lactamase regulating signal transducer with metallopeptidase domain